MTEAEVEFPGYTAGMWSIDPANSEAGFSVRHLGVARVHGRFNAIDGTINVGPTVEQSSVTARIEPDSIDTGFPARDGYIRGEDVLATGEHKQIVFQSTAVRRGPDGLLIDGELTIRSVTRPVTLTAQVGGFGVDPVRNVKVIVRWAIVAGSHGPYSHWFFASSGTPGSGTNTQGPSGV